ncbi:hypothetical protein [Jiangella ureilytica]|uniref:hypothetical protein n=1 Tax=Jiangella ureilytica TaxID=2530374 RepID=UPI00193CB142|nr:hypothetical protein [Jiangella ureilytica]
MAESYEAADPADLDLGARRPRDDSDDPDGPEAGTFGHRNMRVMGPRGRVREPDRPSVMRSRCYATPDES